tara:strand:+ start:12289 stop:13296 length:1008 start_codon:yes stop_codon:yes gene_type:complete
MKILITGVAGFIGFHLANKLLKIKRYEVHGIDNLNKYYDNKLKKKRINYLEKHTNIIFHNFDINNSIRLRTVFKKHNITHVLHFAAQPGVRYSISHPMSYINSNILGFQSMIDCCKEYKIKHLIYASSSSVYGLNTTQPYKSNHNSDHPISLYAATKKSNELVAHSYSHLYGLPTTGLRLFTVYGPWGRPDMALFKFTSAILNNKTINVYNNGNHKRDFTYIDDTVAAIIKIITIPPKKNNLWRKNSNTINQSSAPYVIYNVGSGRTVKLKKFIKILEETIGKKAKIKYTKKQPGDVDITYSDNSELKRLIGFNPKFSLNEGIRNFVNWYKEIYR